jgi:hypothetical protein
MTRSIAPAAAADQYHHPLSLRQLPAISERRVIDSRRP